jgi:hypothetical protein
MVEKNIVFHVAVFLLIYFAQKITDILLHVVWSGEIYALNLPRNRTVNEPVQDGHFCLTQVDANRSFKRHVPVCVGH